MILSINARKLDKFFQHFILKIDSNIILKDPREKQTTGIESDGNESDAEDEPGDEQPSSVQNVIDSSHNQQNKKPRSAYKPTLEEYVKSHVFNNNPKSMMTIMTGDSSSNQRPVHNHSNHHHHHRRGNIGSSYRARTSQGMLNLPVRITRNYAEPLLEIKTLQQPMFSKDDSFLNNNKNKNLKESDENAFSLNDSNNKSVLEYKAALEFMPKFVLKQINEKKLLNANALNSTTNNNTNTTNQQQNINANTTALFSPYLTKSTSDIIDNAAANTILLKKNSFNKLNNLKSTPNFNSSSNNSMLMMNSNSSNSFNTIVNNSANNINISSNNTKINGSQVMKGNTVNKKNNLY
jgi:hypothetical protein